MQWLKRAVDELSDLFKLELVHLYVFHEVLHHTDDCIIGVSGYLFWVVVLFLVFVLFFKICLLDRLTFVFSDLEQVVLELFVVGLAVLRRRLEIEVLVKVDHVEKLKEVTLEFGELAVLRSNFFAHVIGKGCCVRTGFEKLHYADFCLRDAQIVDQVACR